MSEIRVDTISEKTSANGVAIDSVTLKDGGATLTDNITFSASGKGVHLGVTTATASNLLDDYEEGTWTPDFGNISTPSYSSRSGRYTKIGRLVYCTGEYVVSSLDTGDASTYNITGLPFTGNADEETCVFTLGRSINLLGSQANQILINNIRFIGSNFMLMKNNDDGLSYSSGASSGTLQFAITYAT